LLSLLECPSFRAIFDHCHHSNIQYYNLGSHNYIPILPNFLQRVKNTMSLGYSIFKIFKATTGFNNNTTKVREPALLIDLFINQRHLFTFAYS